jgi:hypothetical protein
MADKSKVHEIVIRIRVNKPITAKQARYAAWNAIHAIELWGNEDDLEPWAKGKITVRLNPRKRAKSKG